MNEKQIMGWFQRRREFLTSLEMSSSKRTRLNELNTMEAVFRAQFDGSMNVSERFCQEILSDEEM